MTNVNLLNLIFLFVLLALLSFWAWSYMIRMPGDSYSAPLPSPTSKEVELSLLLRSDVEMLAGRIGARNLYRPMALSSAADFIENRFKEYGYTVVRENFEVEGRTCQNIMVEIPGDRLREEIIVIGAHYDTADESPGANDNATGVAALLALARAFSGEKTARTLRLVAFTNEEPPSTIPRPWGAGSMPGGAGSAMKISLPCSVLKQ